MPATQGRLYKRDNTGSTRVWWAEIRGSAYRLNSGQLNGAIITSDWTRCEGKNSGRSNETTAEEQCKKEVEALYKKKLKRGYTPDVNSVDNAKEALIKPMLAHRYEDHSHKLKWPLYSQPKLDGIRCIARADGLWSRKGEPINTVPHIADIVIEVCKEYNVVLDGELYNHSLRDDFNEIASLVRRQKVDKAHADKVRDLVQYHIYDLIDETQTFGERIRKLRNLTDLCDWEEIVFVPTIKSKDRDDLNEDYEEYLSKGYEGQMVRQDTVYQFKRTDALLKRKEFQDEEFEIVDMIEGRGNRSGMVGAVVLSLDGRRTFQAALMGTNDYRRAIWKEHQKNSFAGIEATVKYFHRTPDGVPRFPVVKSIDWTK